MKTWEVKLLAGNNGVVQMNVEADGFDIGDGGVEFSKGEENEQTAFFPLDKLLSIREVTP